MSHVAYRKPREGEQFIDYERREFGKQDVGTIVVTNDRERDCIVRFNKTRIEYQGNCCIRINGILHNENVLMWQPELKTQLGAETRRYLYDDIDYISHKEGVGAWVSDE